jgi:hypothetical protein
LARVALRIGFRYIYLKGLQGSGSVTIKASKTAYIYVVMKTKKYKNQTVRQRATVEFKSFKEKLFLVRLAL